MSVFNAAEFDGHEQVVFINEPAVGLRAIIAIHNSRRIEDIDAPTFTGIEDYHHRWLP